jgi:hypothetical protein
MKIKLSKYKHNPLLKCISCLLDDDLKIYCSHNQLYLNSVININDVELEDYCFINIAYQFNNKELTIIDEETGNHIKYIKNVPIYEAIENSRYNNMYDNQECIIS